MAAHLRCPTTLRRCAAWGGRRAPAAAMAAPPELPTDLFLEVLGEAAADKRLGITPFIT